MAAVPEAALVPGLNAHAVVGAPGPSTWRVGLSASQSSAPLAAEDTSPKNALELVRLPPVMDLTAGSADVVVGLVDGPVALDHPALARATVREAAGAGSGACSGAGSAACTHGTAVAGMLVADRTSPAPSICPGCTLLVRPIFGEEAGGDGLPSASPDTLAAAIVQCLEGGARVVNVSASLLEAPMGGRSPLREALEDASRRGAIVVAAAGNQGSVGGSAITQHPSVIPVAACDREGRPLVQSNLGSSIGRRGLSAPGSRIASLGSTSAPTTFSGTSAAAPFVTGTVALVWSLFPQASTAAVRLAVTDSGHRRRRVVPPLLDAWAAYRFLARTL